MHTKRPNDLWIILGASSSIGRSLAAEIAVRQSALILAGRDMEDLEHIACDLTIRHDVDVKTVAFDALDMNNHADFVQKCMDAAGSKTVNIALVFGDMPDPSDMDKDVNLALQCVHATYTGAVSVLNHFVPIMESQKAGKILAFGSVAGDRGRFKNYLYGSAKAGLHTYLSGLRNRLGRFGVTVTTIKPGFIDTAMIWGLEGVFLVASPQALAKASYNACIKAKNEVYYPFFWWGIMMIIRSTPECIFKKLKV